MRVSWNFFALVLVCSCLEPVAHKVIAQTSASAAVRQEPAAAHPDPTAIVRKMVDFYRKTQCLEVRCEIVDRFKADKETTTTMNATIVAQRPNRLAVRVEVDSGQMGLACDGSKMWIYCGPNPAKPAPSTESPEGVFRASKAPDSLAELLEYDVSDGMIGMMPGERPLVLTLLDDDPFAVLMRDVNTVTYVGKERLGDQLAHHIAFKEEVCNWEIWIAADREPLVLQVKTDTTQIVKFMAANDAASNSGSVTQRFTGWSFPRMAKAGNFAFSPPKGYVNTPDFRASPRPSSPIEVRKTAPDISIPLIDGQRLKLRHEPGVKAIVLCYGSQAVSVLNTRDLFRLSRLAEQYEKRGVRVCVVESSIGAAARPGALQEWLNSKFYRFRVATDWPNEIAQAFGERRPLLLEFTVIIDERGVIRAAPNSHGAELKRELEAVLSDTGSSPTRQ
jgi:alkyl hydroperoxide reductase subunit AhpC